MKKVHTLHLNPLLPIPSPSSSAFAYITKAVMWWHVTAPAGCQPPPPPFYPAWWKLPASVLDCIQHSYRSQWRELCMCGHFSTLSSHVTKQDGEGFPQDIGAFNLPLKATAIPVLLRCSPPANEWPQRSMRACRARDHWGQWLTAVSHEQCTRCHHGQMRKSGGFRGELSLFFKLISLRL